MDLSDLKRLAGAADFRGGSTSSEPVDRNKITAKLGIDGWFKQMFPVNDIQMPVVFRGRKK
jgi:hypothetical protein